MINEQKSPNIDAPSLVKSLDYIDAKWDSLSRYEPDDRGTLVGLPYSYIVPSDKTGSGFTFDEMYYWDSFFIAQALLDTNRKDQASDMLENLLYLAKRFDIIPNGNRYYFTGRSQPPFLTTYILDVYEKTGDLAWLRESMVVAEYEYNRVWMGAEQPNWRNIFHGLSRYYDINVVDALAEAESGWDMTTRFGDKCLCYIPIDLNSLLYKYEVDFAIASELAGDFKGAKDWRKKAKERKNNVDKYLWDDNKKFYFDYNFKTGNKSEVWSLAAYYALWSGIASPEQAKYLVNHLDKFTCDGGLSTTEKVAEKQIVANRQWAYPNGWAPLHWLTVNGLEKYGYSEEARHIALKWIATCCEYFEHHGVFREAYNVTSLHGLPNEGLYPPQIGFGWSNAVYMCFAIKYTEAGKDWQRVNNGKPRSVKRVLKKIKRVLHKKLISTKI